MKKRITFLTLMFLGLTAFVSCSDDEEVNDPGICGTAWAAAVEDEATTFSLALQAYASDPSAENCGAYKVALQAYIDALKPYGDCTTLTGQQRTNWETAIAEAEASIDDIEC